MIVLDTNIVSESMKPEPDENVMAWLQSLEPSAVYISSITAAELLTGAALLPDSKRKLQLQNILAQRVIPAFDGRVLHVDLIVASQIAQVTSTARAAGNDIDFPDAAIAATALAHGYVLATRNTRDFLGAGIELINPWQLSG
ncbi:MAG: type II toxin-antitoxin system VapC family toxin [Brachymonas sp.]|nr:type II toxin-antitoxin system VapC family toxin [Brachymonas sp.]